MKKIHIKNITLGCDPEFFFSKNGKIIGSEKVIKNNNSQIIIDGVQAELNPSASSCRQSLAEHISSCFRSLNEMIKKDDTIKIDTATTIKIDPKELKSLSKNSQRFGCAPSKNKDGDGKIKIKDASKYYYRSAGGHIHLGSYENPKILVPILDIIVGNTCVLIDRDKGNIIRRKIYGKAGEYRTPPHGLEYRTLSNFWLRDYKLMSFVMGLARMAVSIVDSSKIYKTKGGSFLWWKRKGKTIGHNYAKQLLDVVNMKDINKAINTNDYKLALKNFKKIEPILNEIIPTRDAWSVLAPLDKTNIKYFKYFAKKGLNYWFKNNDIINHWTKCSKAVGWETFLKTTVKDDYNKKRKNGI